MSGWLKGAIFSAIFLLLIFFLKIVCPLNVGCFVDPFLVPIFSPLLLVEFVTGTKAYQTLGSYEPAFVLAFWVVIGAILGELFKKIKFKEDAEEDGD